MVNILPRNVTVGLFAPHKYYTTVTKLPHLQLVTGIAKQDTVTAHVLHSHDGSSLTVLP